MTGWWFSNTQEFEWIDSNKKNVVFSFGSNKKLIFSDIRNFGTLIFTSNPYVIQYELDKIAFDIADNNAKFNHQVISRIEYITAKKPDELIEDVLIDQKAIFSGIGNYLKSEILYLAGVSPLRKLKSINIDTWKIIFKCSRKIIKKMYRILIGNTLESYIDAMKVYQKKTDPQGLPISKHKTKDQRTTFYVKSKQI